VNYFPGVPQDFPTPDDIRVARALVKMARMLHGYVEPSSRWPGHEMRMGGHEKRIRDAAGRRESGALGMGITNDGAGQLPNPNDEIRMTNQTRNSNDEDPVALPG
jgi:hypothetical protein